MEPTTSKGMKNRWRKSRKEEESLKVWAWQQGFGKTAGAWGPKVARRAEEKQPEKTRIRRPRPTATPKGKPLPKKRKQLPKKRRKPGKESV